MRPKELLQPFPYLIELDHPPNVIRGIPLSINKRLSAISSTEKEFNEAKDAYQKALNESGYSYTLTYEESTPPLGSTHRTTRPSSRTSANSS